MRRIKIALVLLLSGLMIGVTACGVNNTEQPLTRGRISDNNVSPYYANDYDNRIIMGQDGLQEDRYRYNMRATNTNAEAKKMADSIAKIKGVDDATVVIAGGNVYVALDLDDQVQTDQAVKVEKEVHKKLSQMNSRYRIMITSDADLFGRLRDVGDGLRAGTPTNVYDNDFRMFDRNFRSNIR